jgi:hypothetical protein
VRPRSRDYRGRSVYPHDAGDIKAHKWFRDIPWDHLHLIPPPFVPQIAGVEDTHYFDEEEPISDWSDSGDSENDDTDDAEMEAAFEANSLALMADTTNLSLFAPPIPAPHAAPFHNAHPSSTAIRRSPQKLAALQAQLAAFPRHVRPILAQFVAAPYDSTRLKRIDREIDAFVASNATSPAPAQQQQQQQHEQQSSTSSTVTVPSHLDLMVLGDQMKAFVRTFGRRERKRPRDRLLRDCRTKATVLEVRKQTAFLGYTFCRAMDVDTVSTISTFDGAGRDGIPGMGAGVGTRGAMDRITEVVGEVGGGVELMGIKPGDAVHVAAVYRAFHHQGPGSVSMGW